MLESLTVMYFSVKGLISQFVSTQPTFIMLTSNELLDRFQSHTATMKQHDDVSFDEQIESSIACR